MQRELISACNIQREIRDSSGRAQNLEENRTASAKGLVEQLRAEVDKRRALVATVEEERKSVVYERDGALAQASLSKKKENDIVSMLGKVCENRSWLRQQMTVSCNRLWRLKRLGCLNC